MPVYCDAFFSSDKSGHRFNLDIYCHRLILFRCVLFVPLFCPCSFFLSFSSSLSLSLSLSLSFALLLLFDGFFPSSFIIIISAVNSCSAFVGSGPFTSLLSRRTKRSISSQPTVVPSTRNNKMIMIQKKRIYVFTYHICNGIGILKKKERKRNPRYETGRRWERN